MATAGIRLGLEVTDLKELQSALGNLFRNADKARIVKAALEKAIEPTVARLRITTPLGPTGNLRAAIDKKVIPYAKSGNAIALVGYRRAAQEDSDSAAGGRVRVSRGKKGDRGRHQYWLERGTKARKVDKAVAPKPYSRKGGSRGSFQRQQYTMTRNGKQFVVQGHTVSAHSVAAHEVREFKIRELYYASSYRSLGQFQIRRSDRTNFTTDPPSPRAFFKKSNKPFEIPPMPRGGSTGQPPLETAWNQTQTTVAEILSRELNIALGRALDSLTRSTQTLESVT